MIKAESADKPLVVEILSQSFNDNLSVNYIVRNDSKKRQGVRALMDYSFEVCSEFGEVWLSDNRKACALLLYPQNKRTSLKSIWLDIKLIIQAIGIGGISKALSREGKIKAKQLSVNKVYLWFIGVELNSQQKGIGSRLLGEIIASANAKQLPVYLETSTLKNLPWYERFNFYTYDQLELGYTLFFLKREPDQL